MSVEDKLQRLSEALLRIPEEHQIAPVGDRIKDIIALRRNCEPIGARCNGLSDTLIRLCSGNPPVGRYWMPIATDLIAVALAERRELQESELATFLEQANAEFTPPPEAPPVPAPLEAPFNEENTDTNDSLVQGEDAAGTAGEDAAGTAGEDAAGGGAAGDDSAETAVALRGSLAPSLYTAVIEVAEAEARGRLDLLEGAFVKFIDEFEAHPPVYSSASETRTLLRLAQRVRRRASRARWGWLSAVLPGIGSVVLAIVGVSETLAAFYGPAGLIILALTLRREYNLNTLLDGADRLCKELSEQLRLPPADDGKPG